MMRIRYSLACLVAAASANGLAMYGCSADANAPTDEQPDASIEQDGSIDPGPQDEGGTSDGGGSKDGGIKDSGPDAKMRADVGPPGSPCYPVGQNQADPNGCGFCGDTTRVCLQGDAGAGVDAGVWSQWGACTGEVITPDRCDPTIADAGIESCGNCGHRQIICGLDCHKNMTLVCQGEPPMSCSPTSTKFTVANGCPANQGRSQTCGNDCTWGAPSGCIDPPQNPNFITASKTAGTVVSKGFSLTSAPTSVRLNTTTSCPSTLSTSTLYNATPNIYVQINNTDSVAHSYEVWESEGGGGPTTMSSVLTAYGLVIPSTDAERMACTGKVKSGCSTTTPALSPACTGFSGLVGVDAITIPAGAFAQIYISAYSNTTTVGAFQLNVRTK